MYQRDSSGGEGEEVEGRPEIGGGRLKCDNGFPVPLGGGGGGGGEGRGEETPTEREHSSACSCFHLAE